MALNSIENNTCLYSIHNDTCLGFLTLRGAVNVKGRGYVELSDEEVAKIVDLIRQKGTTDIGKLNLEEIYPDIYEKLREAYYDKEELHWLWEGYICSYFEYDADELMTYCEENCGFHFEYNKENYIEDGEFNEDALHDDKAEAFNAWLDDYVSGLEDSEVKNFFYNHMNANLELDDVKYSVGIPGAIIKLAEKKE